MDLLDDRFAPITSSIGFIECPARAAAEGMRAWMAPIVARGGTSIHERVLEGTFAQELEQLLPLNSVIPRRELFVPTASPWTAYFDSGYRGTDAATPMAGLARRLGCRALRVTSVRDTIEEAQRRGRYGAVVFELYGPEDTHFSNHVRSIACVNDGGRWSFSASGAVQPFEQPERYRARRVRDRFDHALLRAYLEALGIRAFDADFYAPPGTSAFLLARVGPPAKGEREYTLAEARAEWGE